MYGSIHTHFESIFDTGNALKDMLLAFQEAGAKKVAVTEHGSMSSYEDLKDTINKIKKDGGTIDVDIIPGIECYFKASDSSPRTHLILVAKDYEGYLSLCRIVTEAGKHVGENGKHDNIVTWENLERNVAKGHLVCTSACIAGPFGMLFGLNRFNIIEKMDKARIFLNEHDYDRNLEIVRDYEEKKAYASTIKPKVSERKAAEAVSRKTDNDTALREWYKKKEEYDALHTFLLNDAEYKTAQSVVKECTKNANAYQKHKKELEEVESEDPYPVAVSYFRRFTDIFGADDFYFEIQNHGIKEEDPVYNQVVSFAVSVGHPRFIASNDIHIGATKDHPDVIRDLREKRNISQFRRFNTYMPEQTGDDQLYIKDDDELREWLLKTIRPAGTLSAEEIVDTAIANIENVLSQCSVEFPKDQNHYPKFSDDENALFEELIQQGIQKKFGGELPSEEYRERLKQEIEVIETMGYAGYHLIVQDYLEYGRLLGYLTTAEEIENAPLSIEELDRYITEREYPRIGYSIGPGRGSAAGSLCCYLLGITDIDPIKYGLLFERFLNVERVSMPDIDSDFRTDIRKKVEEYCHAKYGQNNVCKIVTKAYAGTKGALGVAARYLGSRDYENEPDPKPNLKVYLKDKGWYRRADVLSKEFSSVYPEAADSAKPFPEEKKAEHDDIDRKIIALADKMCGLFMNYGEHAAGVIISADDIGESLPLMWNETNGDIETQCTMGQAEAKGFLKMDFLGLDNLCTITEILQRPSDGILDWKLNDYEKREEVINDPRIYEEIFDKGLTQGVFQFESPGMKKMLRDFKPEKFEDLILLVAAYRPGPIGYIPEIIDAKWRERDPKYKKGETLEKSITLDNADLKEILAPTYGCPIYQEQIMEIFRKMAGYSLGQADLVRRAMSKKKEAELKAGKKAFIFGDEEKGIEGCIKKQGMTEQEADDLFEQMMPFAKYGFNKSHATAYALLSVFTAYQKLYHTLDFYKATLNADRTGYDKYPALIEEMKKFGIRLLPPSLMLSKAEFSIEGNAIRFGFKSIKGFSDIPIIRTECLQEFIEKNPNVSNSVIEGYIKVGMFKTCWRTCANEAKRVNNDRHAILKWLETNEKNLRGLIKERGRIAALKEEALTSEDPQSVNKKITAEKKKAAVFFEALKAEHVKDIQGFVEKSLICEEDEKEVIESRAWEMELMMTTFLTEDSIRKISASKNRNTFKDLEEDDALVPAVVMSVGAAHKTKSSGNTYYPVMLMDRTGAVIERRFALPPNVTDGIFKLPGEEHKFFNVKETDISQVVENGEKKDYVPDGRDVMKEVQEGAAINIEDVEGKTCFSLTKEI